MEHMLDQHKRQAARTPADREMYAGRIAATDKEINALVYELYGLTEEEIAVVETAERPRWEPSRHRRENEVEGSTANGRKGR
jgi:hypothetical protein